jgi:hypothetical protein
MSLTQEQIRVRRDAKVQQAMADFAPVWLENEEYRVHEDSVLFNLIYAHPVHGWLNERFRYDAFNDVLYHMGERRLKEVEVLPYEERAAYVAGEVATRVPFQPAALSGQRR